MNTDYGFAWGPATVERVATIERAGKVYRVLQISSGGHLLNIYISPQGRSLRVFKDGRELK